MSGHKLNVLLVTAFTLTSAHTLILAHTLTPSLLVVTFHLLITFANGSDLDQDQQNVWIQTI